MAEIVIEPLTADPKNRRVLSDILTEVVANGGSVGFMHPLDRGSAEAFWDGALTAAERGDRIVLGAWDGEALVGTLTLLIAMPPNQPHRAELAKMMVRPSHRGRGIASALVRVAEGFAAHRKRWLLVLDTATDEGASGLYERLGYTRAGEIPDFALKPHGGLTGTLLYWKRVGLSAVRVASSPPRGPAPSAAPVPRGRAVRKVVRAATPRRRRACRRAPPPG